MLPSREEACAAISLWVDSAKQEPGWVIDLSWQTDPLINWKNKYWYIVIDYAIYSGLYDRITALCTLMNLIGKDLPAYADQFGQKLKDILDSSPSVQTDLSLPEDL